jgi:hypothetical protein
MPKKSTKRVQGFPCKDIQFSAFFFHNFRDGIYTKYPIIYGDQQDREDASNRPKEPGESKQSSIDFYYNSMMLCAGDDILKIEPVLKLSLNEVLGYLSYRIDKSNKQRQKEQNSIG